MKMLLGILCMLSVAGAAGAASIDKVDVPDKAVVGNQTLVLNGVGLRTKFWVHVYIGALYLPAQAHTTQAVLAAQGPDRILMHMEYAASRDQMVDGFTDDFSNNLPAQEHHRLQDKIKTFTSYFGDTHEGEQILIDYLPDSGTRVTIDGQVKGTIPGDDFHRAVLLVWLGDHPADGDLKEGMLGKG